MPFTPFHLGPALLVGLILPMDLPLLLVASVILDIEPAYYMFISYPGYLHGFFHSYLGATLAGLALCFAAMRMTPRPFGTTLTAALVGVYSHVFLDSFLYTDIRPFYPFQANPFYMTVSPADVYSFCTFTFLPAFIVGIYKIWNSTQR
jgi:membrane-bound metal-dependent hydrolase YbcI (DUF457 family)